MGWYYEWSVVHATTSSLLTRWKTANRCNRRLLSSCWGPWVFEPQLGGVWKIRCSWKLWMFGCFEPQHTSNSAKRWSELQLTCYQDGIWVIKMESRNDEEWKNVPINTNIWVIKMFVQFGPKSPCFLRVPKIPLSDLQVLQLSDLLTRVGQPKQQDVSWKASDVSWKVVYLIHGTGISYSRWWFQIFFIFTLTWGNNQIHQFWLISFKWAETTFLYTLYIHESVLSWFVQRNN